MTSLLYKWTMDTLFNKCIHNLHKNNILRMITVQRIFQKQYKLNTWQCMIYLSMIFIYTEKQYILANDQSGCMHHWVHCELWVMKSESG